MNMQKLGYAIISFHLAEKTMNLISQSDEIG